MNSLKSKLNDVHRPHTSNVLKRTFSHDISELLNCMQCDKHIHTESNWLEV